MIFESDRSSRDSDFLAVQVALFNTKGLYSSKVIRMFALQFKIEKGYSRLTCGRVWTPSIAELRLVSIKSRSTDRPNRALHNGHGGKNGCELDV